MGLICAFWGKGGQWSQELCDSSRGVATWQQLGNTCLQNEGSSRCWVLDQLHLPKEALVKGIVNPWAFHALRLTSILS